MSTNSIQTKQSIPLLPSGWETVNGRPYLAGTKCGACGAAFFPPLRICPYCLTDESVQKARLGNTGRLYAYTIIHVSSKEFNPPYLFGYVILDPENIRIPALLTGIGDYNELKTGMKMEMIIEKLRDDDQGNELITYKFKPVAEK